MCWEGVGGLGVCAGGGGGSVCEWGGGGGGGGRGTSLVTNRDSTQLRISGVWVGWGRWGGGGVGQGAGVPVSHGDY